MKISKSLMQNKKVLKALLPSDDVIFFDFVVGSKDALAVYVDSITDREMLGLEVLSPLKSSKISGGMKSIAKKITSANIKQVDEIKAAADELLRGSTLILIDGKIGGITVDLKKFDVRAIAEPPTELAIRGPRNGFIESIKTNLSLVRRYLKTPSLKIEMLQVGKYTSTNVALMSIDGITDDKLTDKIRKKLQSIDIDGIPDSSYLTKMLNERKNSLFKQIGSTERPDVNRKNAGRKSRNTGGRFTVCADAAVYADRRLSDRRGLLYFTLPRKPGKNAESFRDFLFGISPRTFRRGGIVSPATYTVEFSADDSKQHQRHTAVAKP